MKHFFCSREDVNQILRWADELYDWRRSIPTRSTTIDRMGSTVQAVGQWARRLHGSIEGANFEEHVEIEVRHFFI